MLCPIAAFLLVTAYLALCTAKILYVETLADFQACFPTKKTVQLPKSYRAVFLHAALTLQEMKDFPKMFPLVKHFQLIAGIFYAICIDFDRLEGKYLGFLTEPLKTDTLPEVVQNTPVRGNVTLTSKPNYYFPTKNPFKNNYLFVRPYSLVDYYKWNAVEIENSNYIEETALAACIQQSIKYLFAFHENLDFKKAALNELITQLKTLLAVSDNKLDLDFSDDNDNNVVASSFTNILMEIFSFITGYVDPIQVQFLNLTEFVSANDFDTEPIDPAVVQAHESVLENIKNYELNVQNPYRSLKPHLFWQYIPNCKSIRMMALMAHIMVKHGEKFPDLASSVPLFESLETFDIEWAKFRKGLMQKIGNSEKNKKELQESFLNFIPVFGKFIYTVKSQLNDLRGRDNFVKNREKIQEIFYDIRNHLSYLDFIQMEFDKQVEERNLETGEVKLVRNPKKHPIFLHYSLLSLFLNEFERQIIVPIENMKIETE